MSGHRKLLGLAALAIVAVASITATSASATSFKAGKSPSWLAGGQWTKNVITVNGGTIKCSTAVFEGEAAISVLTFTSFSVHPEFKGCTAFGQEASVSTKISITGCNFVMALSGLGPTGPLSISCTEGFKIVVTPKIAGCSIEIGPQSKSSVTYENQAGGELSVTLNVAELTYTSSGGICGSSGSNGTYSGSIRFTAYDSQGHLGTHTLSVE